MSQRKSLLEMPEADLRPAAAALIMIDTQHAEHEYRGGRLALPDAGPAVAALVRLLPKARETGAPVHVEDRACAGGLLDREGSGRAIIDALRPALGGRVVHTSSLDARAGTELDFALGGMRKTQRVFGAFTAHMCVGSTERMAPDLSHKPNMACDGACDTRSARSAGRGDRDGCHASGGPGRAGRSLRQRGRGPLHPHEVGRHG